MKTESDAFAQVDRLVALVARLVAIVIATTVGLVIGAVVALELYDKSVTVEEISVPQELSQAGYTPFVVAREILGEWQTIDRTATTTKRRQEVSLSQGDVQVPLAGDDVSIGAIVDYFRNKFGTERIRVRGSVVISDSAEGECAVAGCYRFILEITGRGLGLPDRFEITGSKADVDGLVRRAARTAVERLDPYLLANFYYASRIEDEPNRDDHVYRLTGIVLENAPSDDDPWAHTLLGAMANRQEEWSTAIGHLDRALELDPDFASALNSRCWAKSNVPDQVASAIEDCRAALRLNPQSFETMDSLAVAFERHGQSEAAFDMIRCALPLARQAPPRQRSSVERTYARLAAASPNATDTAPSEERCEALVSPNAPTQRRSP